jgi:hypothetical protein
MSRETVTLESDQWTQLLNILTSISMAWTITNPLVMAIGGQVQAQRQQVLPQGVIPNGSLIEERRGPGDTATGPAAAGLGPNIVRGTGER